MQIGITGLPYSGKSTLFATLLSRKSESDPFHKKETEKGIVKVPDVRLDRLTEIFNPRRKVPATIEYLKVPGLESQSSAAKGLAPQFLANLKSVDVILLIVRAFDNPLYPHPLNRIDPQGDINFVNSEFLLNDLAIVETRIERLKKQLSKVHNSSYQKELELLFKCRNFLEDEKPLRSLALSPEEDKILRGFQFLTAKPLIIVLNIDEKEIQHTAEITKNYAYLKTVNTTYTVLCAELEKEISELDPAEQPLFLTELGISEPALNRLIRLSYELLGYISFFTVGEDECRAWTIINGDNAQKAGRAIHSDIERGFIRAEVVHYTTLLENGNLSTCRAKGLIRSEGRDYIVKDGDVIEFRFNV